MTNTLLLADLHLHHLPAWRLKWCEEFVDNLLSTNVYDDLFILGDVLEVRDKVDSRVLNLFLKLVQNWPTGSVFWLTGQHDSYKPGKATLHELDGQEIANGTIVVIDDGPYNGHKNKNLWFIPYQRRKEVYREHLRQVPSGATVFTHILVKEALPGLKIPEDSISAKEFERFRIAISGDVHNYASFGNFHYIGAPSQRDWRDKRVVGQIGVFDGENFKRIPTTHPKHLEVEKESDIPNEGQYIIRAKRGKILGEKENVLNVVETVLDFDSVQLRGKKTTEEAINEYVSVNKIRYQPEKLAEIGLNLMKVK